jgi:signal peptidase I
VAALCACAALLAGCGSKGGGTTIVITTTNKEPARTLRVPSGSMEPTYSIGERVTVRPGKPQLGAVVIFHPPESAQQGICAAKGMGRGTSQACAEPGQEQSGVVFIKRIVGGPGQSIYIREGHVFFRPPGESTFVRERDPYIRPCPVASQPECNFPTPITIPAGDWFLMGDNRGESDDSRFWGPVPTSWIVGYAAD